MQFSELDRVIQKGLYVWIAAALLYRFVTLQQLPWVTPRGTASKKYKYVIAFSQKLEKGKGMVI